MSKNYNRYGEESKKTDKYGMTDEKNENAKTQKKENCYGSDSYDKSSTNRYSRSALHSLKNSLHRTAPRRLNWTRS